MKSLLYITLLMMVLMLLFASCKKTSASEQQNQAGVSVEVSSDLWGYKVNPPNSSPAHGQLTGAFDTKKGELVFQLTYDSMIPISAHLHKGYFPDNGEIVMDLPLNETNMISGRISFNAADANTLLNGGYYIDVHSQTLPEGEIRGQIEKKR